jgi:hypothetical protein
LPFFAAKGACGIARLLSFEPNPARLEGRPSAVNLITVQARPPTPTSRRARRFSASSLPTREQCEHWLREVAESLWGTLFKPRFDV